jgi:hypothetical protein
MRWAILPRGFRKPQEGATVIGRGLLFLMLTVLSINLIGDGLRDLLKAWASDSEVRRSALDSTRLAASEQCFDFVVVAQK